MGHENDLPDGWQWSGIEGADLPMAPGWTVAPSPQHDPLATLFAPPEGDDGLRPTVVLRRAASQGASLAAISAQGMAQMLTQWEGSTLVSNDAMTLQGHEVRAQRYLLEAAGRSAVLERWLVATGSTVVELNGTVPVSRFLEVGPEIEQMMMNARFQDAPPTAPAPDGGAVPEPRLDQQMSEAVGLRLETMHGLRQDQGYLMAGPTVTESALQFLQDAAPAGALGTLVAGQSPDEVALLEAQGLVQDGKLTEEADRLLAPVLDQQAYLRVVLIHRGRESHLHLWMGNQGLTTVAAGAPLHNLVEFSQADHQRLRDVYVLDVSTTEGVPAIVARWMGLGPTWPVQASNLRMTARQLEDRVADGPGAAADPSASLGARVSDSQWVSITLEQVPVGTGPSITLVHALGAGYLQPAPAEGGHQEITDDTELQFASLPPRQLLDLIVGVIDHLLSAD